MPRKEYCPKCGALLKATKTTRMVCSATGCSFKDRRAGVTMIDPLADRREGTNRYLHTVEPYDPTRDVWGADRRWSKN